VGSKKPPLSEEEQKDRGWRREVRRYAWTQGGHGTQFQACIAKLAYPPADAAFIKHLVALAWTPHYAAILQRILDEARRDPGQGGFDRAIEAAGEAFDDILSEPPNQGGWPERTNDKLLLWVNFNVHLFRAQQRGKVSKAAVMKAFVKLHGKDQPWPVNTVPALRKILGQVECTTPKELRDGMLEIYSKP
jgi:hypothetical protein